MHEAIAVTYYIAVSTFRTGRIGYPPQAQKGNEVFFCLHPPSTCGGRQRGCKALYVRVCQALFLSKTGSKGGIFMQKQKRFVSLS